MKMGMTQQILIVDDDMPSLAIFQAVLTASGYQVHTANNGEIALELLSQHRVDLVITDLYMPDKEGIELIREIRQKDKEVKIIAVSGGMSSPVDVSNLLHICLALGANATLQKPVSGDTLRAKVHELIGEED
jgi:two-component system chemotaxis response regulator CheY